METRAVDDMGALLPRRARRREWIGLAIIALPCMLYSLDLTVLNLALPSLSADLKPTAAQTLWIVDIYGFVAASMLITMGTMGDRVGRRRLLLLGAAAFGVASVLAAFSNSAGMLIATRAILGIAGATLAPATLSLIRNMFHDPNDRAAAISIWVSSYSLGGAVGPVVGGVLIEHFWWGSVFLIGVPVMVFLLVLGPALLPEYRDPNAGRLDLASAVLSLSAVVTVIFGLKRVAEYGLAWEPVLSIAAGATIAWLFLHRQAHLRAPMIDLQLFRVPGFVSALTTYAVVSFVAAGSSIFVAQYMQLVLGLRPLEAGLWTLPLALAFTIGSTVTPLLRRRLRPAPLMIAGLALAAIGFAMLSCVTVSTRPTMLAAICSTYALGLAPVFTLTSDLIVGSASPEKAGSASSISETCSEFGGALGIAVLGSIGAAVFRITMSGGSPMEPTTGTIGAAVEAAHHIGGVPGATLLVASRTSFVQGLRAAAIVSTVVLSITAVLAARGLLYTAKRSI